MYIYIYMHMPWVVHTCVYVCVYIYMYVCMYIYVYVYMEMHMPLVGVRDDEVMEDERGQAAKEACVLCVRVFCVLCE